MIRSHIIMLKSLLIIILLYCKIHYLLMYFFYYHLIFLFSHFPTDFCLNFSTKPPSTPKRRPGGPRTSSVLKSPVLND